MESTSQRRQSPRIKNRVIKAASVGFGMLVVGIGTAASPGPNACRCINCPCAIQSTQGRLILRDQDYEFNVQLDHDNKTIHVYTIKAKEPPPPNMGISLYRSPTTGDTVQLNELQLRGTPGLPEYQGRLDIMAESYFGITLQIPMSGQSFRILSKGTG